MAECTNKIIGRRYYKVDVQLKEPLCVSSGEGNETDHDCIVNGANEYIIPGSSLVGAFRNHLEKERNKENSPFGYSAGADGRMSSVFISDLVLNGAEVSVRDFVKLDEEKRAVEGGKFDMQIVETGATGSFYLEIVERENSESLKEEEIASLLNALNSGDIRFGSRKNRGFGTVCLTGLSQASFTKEKKDEWLKFLEDWDWQSQLVDEERVKTWVNGILGDSLESSYYTVTVPLKQEGGISIRTYSTQPGEADYSHLTCHGNPVIPGSSLAGAVYAEAKRILKEACKLLNINNSVADGFLEHWFGKVAIGEKGNKDKSSWQSRVIFSETVLNGAHSLPMTRTAIDRFSAAPNEGALYSEVTYVGGTADVTIRVRKEDGYEAFIGLLKLVLESLIQGYLAIGGETAIGRGLFSLNSSFPLEDKDTEYNKALYRYLSGKGEASDD